MKTKYIKRKGMLLSSVAMLGTAMLLTACGGDGGDSPVDDFGSNPGEGDNQALLYAYPDNGQEEISTAAPVVLRFSSAVNLGEAQNSITVYEGDAQSGTMVAVTPESVAGEPNNVLLQPDEDLKPNQTYTVVIEDLRLRKGVAKDQTLTFTTRPLHEGPKNLVVKEDTFEISRRMPDGSAMEPVMDFSSFRFQFTQPIDRATATYGDGNTVVLRDSAGDPVDATLLIDGAYMTVDPDAEYLNAGETYTLDITADLTSTYGETFGTESYTFTPKDSSPGREPAILVQKLTQGSTSRLTGKPVNEVPVNGTLLGENKNITQASAEVVRAELADVTTYTDVTPIRLPKGTVLKGAAINPILIGGEVPAGFGSGDVTMTVLSDASGYLVPNPYAENNPDALRIVHLLMDVGIATSEARANGAFTQDLLHIELVGLAEVDPEAGVLNLDAVSMVEPNILGQEYGYGMLSFQLQSYKDQNNPPQIAEDTVSPTLQSWMPGANTELQKSGDPIVFNFDEPIDPQSLDGQVTLYENGLEIDAKAHVDGSSVVIKPRKPLSYSLENSPTSYRIQLESGITDLAGNRISALDQSFELATLVQNKTVVRPATGTEVRDELVNHAPVILAVYPGYPCVLEAPTIDLSSGRAGRCAGGMPGISDGTPADVQEQDDWVPVIDVPKQRPIVVQFSKPMETSSIDLGSTFIVEKVDSAGSFIESVDGTVKVNSQSLLFYPDGGWDNGAYYKYTLRSGGYDIVPSSQVNTIYPQFVANQNYDCGLDAICDDSGLPLQTQTLGAMEFLEVDGSYRKYIVARGGPDMDAGGPDLVQYFRGSTESSSVPQLLTAKPLSDANANFFSERNTAANFTTKSNNAFSYQYNTQEYGPSEENDPNSDPAFDPNGVLPSPNSAKIISKGERSDQASDPNVNGISVGCSFQVPLDHSDPIMQECPEHKFTYLTAALVADVTDEVDPEKGVKVNIWPTQIMSTSIDIMAAITLAPGTPFDDQFGANYPGFTGPQILRMRYADNDGDGYRDDPVEGWIDDSDGELTLSADVSLYLDAPYVTAYGLTFDAGHNLNSYKIEMELTGSVSFMEDGRMLVEQYNLNPVDIGVEFTASDGSYFGYGDLVIPQNGNFLQFVSQPIK